MFVFYSIVVYLDLKILDIMRWILNELSINIWYRPVTCVSCCQIKYNINIIYVLLCSTWATLRSKDKSKATMTKRRKWVFYFIRGFTFSSRESCLTVKPIYLFLPKRKGQQVACYWTIFTSGLFIKKTFTYLFENKCK